MKKSVNGLLWGGILFPLILLFWPFASWGDFAGFLLRVIPAVSLQVLLCRVMKRSAVWAIPPVLTGMFALWGTYLYCTCSHWIHATVWDLLRDYLSPFIACTAVFGAWFLRHRKGL